MNPHQQVPIDPAKEAGELADLFIAWSQQIDDFRTGDDVPPGTTPTQLAQLKKRAQDLADQGHKFTADAIGATLQAVQADLTKIKTATATAAAQVTVLNNVSKIISIATAGVALGTSIVSGNLPSIFSTAEELVRAVGV